MGESYVVAAKPSARRVSRPVGEWVAQSGQLREFDSKAAAREWATSASPDAYTLWVQNAHPGDASGADGYLLARRSRLQGHETELPGEQVALGDVGGSGTDTETRRG